MNWTVASDIAERIRNLRELLGGGTGKPMLQEELARRAGVRTSQVSQWERGAQSPSKSRLERWAEREGWPIEIFQDGTPMPAEVLSAPQPEGPPPPGTVAGSGRVVQDANRILARFYEVMADASRRGHPCPPEMAILIQQMYGLVLGDGDPLADPSGAEEAPATGSETESEIPGW